ncbi:MAG: hypothetical protein Q8R25_02645 [bacterium]|nr:hypothetical protein [bacterium]
MPRLDQTNDEMQNFNIGKGGFAFTGARFDKLGASNYTLATAAVDVSGSTGPFRQQLVDMLKMTLDACKKNPRSDNIMFRVIIISDRFPKGVEEVHGFKPLVDIDPTVYDSIRTGGWTPLVDGCYSGVGATNAYAKELKARDYDSNGIVFMITDGAENRSTATMSMLKKELEDAVTSETLESLISILIGINASEYRDELTLFQNEAGITHYKDAGDATPRNLAKLAAFVSQSVSSTALAAGTGGPSQQIAATI